MGDHRKHQTSVVAIALAFTAILALAGFVAWGAMTLLFPQRKPTLSQTKSVRQPPPTASETSPAPEPSTTPPPPPKPRPAKPKPPLPFSMSRVTAHTRYFTETLGPRVEGSDKERQAASYIESRLKALGYATETQKVPLPEGKMSQNVFAVKRGASGMRIVLTAHTDSKSTTPGANDDAVGCAILLELARTMKNASTQPSILFAFVGSEEIMDGRGGNDHHFGSRRYVAGLTKRQRANIAGMISVDVIGYGDTLYARTMQRGPMDVSDMLISFAGRKGVDLSYKPDPGPSGWSDHEAFELAGIPAVWLERLDDPEYHKMGDTADHLEEDKVKEASLLVRDFVLALSKKNVERLKAANEN